MLAGQIKRLNDYKPKNTFAEMIKEKILEASTDNCGSVSCWLFRYYEFGLDSGVTNHSKENYERYQADIHELLSQHYDNQCTDKFDDELKIRIALRHVIVDIHCNI